MTPFSIVARGRLVEYRRPVVMGILNITDDSFYDGGRHRSPDAMLAHAHRLLADGADIIDLGASSSRPGAQLLPPDEEARRLAQALRLLRSELPDAVISVDTCFALPARTAVEAGADIVNDIGGGDLDPLMFNTVAELQVPYILMHGGLQHTRQAQAPVPAGAAADPDSLVDNIVRFFSSRLDTLYRLGVKDVWLDPGFGFAKNADENLRLLDRLDELTSLFREPVLVGLSRKRMIYQPLALTPGEALPGTIALDAIALDRGTAILRVHDPRPAAETITLMQKMKTTLT